MGLLARLAVAAALFFAIDAAVFHSRAYSRQLSPDSAAGSLQMRLQNELRRAKTGPQILTVGDSRLLVQTPLANSLTKNYTFASIGTPGTTPRCWYYMLREVDPAADRYAAIVITVADFDNSELEIGANWGADIAYLAPLLKLSDAAEFSASFDSWSNRWQALRAVLLKGTSYNRDVQDWLAHTSEREKAHQWALNESAEALARYVPADQTVDGLEVDWQARRIVRYPENMDEAGRREARRVLPRDLPAPALHKQYLEKWFSKIVGHYQGSGTRLVFARLPRGPLQREYPKQQPGVLRDYAAQGRVTLLSEHLFDGLERTDLYMDAMHVNARGSEQFTRLLVSETLAALQR